MERLFFDRGVIVEIPGKIQWPDFIGHPPIPGRPPEDEWRTLAPQGPSASEIGTGQLRRTVECCRGCEARVTAPPFVTDANSLSGSERRVSVSCDTTDPARAMDVPSECSLTIVIQPLSWRASQTMRRDVRV